MKTVKTLIVASTVSLLALVGAQAHAGNGFVAQTFIAPFSQELADGLDDANTRLGRPFDRAVATAAGQIVPGADVVLNNAWALQRSGGVIPAPQFQPPMPQPVMPFQPPMFNQQLVGNFCHTPAGRFGPGPVQPIGAPCFAGMPGSVGL